MAFGPGGLAGSGAWQGSVLPLVPEVVGEASTEVGSTKGVGLAIGVGVS